MVIYGNHIFKGDIDEIFILNKRLIDRYEDTDQIDYPKVLSWVRRKLEASYGEYTAVFADGKKAGYYHFYRNSEGEYEIDDLYVFDDFQNKGIGSQIINKCCASVDESVILYVFIRNERAVSLYQKLGFEAIKTVNNTRYVMIRKP